MSRAVPLPLPLPLFINGKYTAQRTTGVQRVAARLVLALDALLADDAAAAQALGPVTLLCPPQSRGRLPALRHIRARPVGAVALPLHLWEQAVLPWAARGGRLLSLAGAAPYWARRPAALLHDAAVWDHPEAYTPAFVRWYRLLFARQARVAQPLLTVSAFSQQRLAACLGLPPQRLQVLHNGADHLRTVVPDDTLLRQHGLPPGGFLLAVANANPTKNLDALVQAHAALPARLALPLVIVGGHNTRVFRDGTAGPVTPAAAAPVLRVGVQGDAVLKALYGAAAALVFPSVYEGFGLPPLEAMGEGCPVLAARAASLPEVCGDAALYCDPADPADMARALVQLLDDPALRQRLRAAGPAQAARYTWAASARGLLATLLPTPEPGAGGRP